MAESVTALPQHREEVRVRSHRHRHGSYVSGNVWAAWGVRGQVHQHIQLQPCTSVRRGWKWGPSSQDMLEPIGRGQERTFFKVKEVRVPKICFLSSMSVLLSSTRIKLLTRHLATQSNNCIFLLLLQLNVAL